MRLGVVTSVSRAMDYALGKGNVTRIRLLAGLGVEGDAHLDEPSSTDHVSRATRRSPISGRCISTTANSTTSCVHGASPSPRAFWANRR